MPCTKRKFDDPMAAGRRMAAVKLLTVSTKSGRPSVYYCGACKAYHWGHENARSARQ